MRIIGFTKIVRKHTVEETINGSTLIIDGQNYFYSLYEESGLSNEFGCESDKYFQFLKDNLEIFKKADVKCYFIFKRGHKVVDTETRALKEALKGEEYKKFVKPIFMWDVHREIMEEMGFKYAYCESEVKPECIALAQQLKCPVLSNDIEYCFAGVPYINYMDLKLDENTQTLKAMVFRLDQFLANTGLDKCKLATFVVLTDEYQFPADYFSKFIRAVVLRNNRTNLIEKYETLFTWLSKTDSEVANRKIFWFISSEDQRKFLEKKDKAINMIQREHQPGVVSNYLFNDCQLDVSENDPFWYEKGVAAAITVPYVSLYRRNVISGTPTVSCDDPELDDPLLLSSDIIRYTYDLLTNFSNAEIVIKSPERNDVQRAPLHVQTGTIEKPEYEAKECVFENGWENIKELKLFEHFLTQQFKGFNFELLNQLPENAKLLMISLFYFKRFSSSDLKEAIMRSILYSYVSLGVINQKGNDLNSSVTEKDKEAAKLAELAEFSTASKVTVSLSDMKMIHSIKEFEHCLNNFSYLNKLCGSPYKPIMFSQMYNGALVYKVLQLIVQEGADDWSFLDSGLGRAPTVLNFMNDLIKVFRDFN